MRLRTRWRCRVWATSGNSPISLPLTLAVLDGMGAGGVGHVLADDLGDGEGGGDVVHAEMVADLRGRGKQVVLDASGPAFAQGVQALPYAIKPNLEELDAALVEMGLIVDTTRSVPRVMTIGRAFVPSDRAVSRYADVVTAGTVPSGYRPPTAINGSAALPGANQVVACDVSTTGVVTIGNGGTSIPDNRSIVANLTWVVA